MFCAFCYLWELHYLTHVKPASSVISCKRHCCKNPCFLHFQFDSFLSSDLSHLLCIRAYLALCMRYYSPVPIELNVRPSTSLTGLMSNQKWTWFHQYLDYLHQINWSISAERFGHAVSLSVQSETFLFLHSFSLSLQNRNYCCSAVVLHFL